MTISDVSVGFAGRYRVGHWAPIAVTVQSDAPVAATIEMLLPDGEGVPCLTTSEPVQLVAGSSVYFGYAKPGRVDGYLEVRLRALETDSLLASHRLAQPELPDAILGSQQLVITLGSDVGMDDAVARRRARRQQETIHAQVSTASQAPTSWIGYQGANVVLLSGSNDGLVGDLSDSQLDAVAHWVRMGGRLIIDCGRRAQEFVQPGQPLARFAPGTFDRIQNQRSTTGLESFAGNTKRRLDSYVLPGELNFSLPVARFNDLAGRIESTEGFGTSGSPTIIRTSFGFGQVVFLAFDLGVPPVSQWEDGRRQILARLMDLTIGKPPSEEDEPGFDLAQVGYDDLIGQLRGSLDQFPGVRLVPFSWIGVLVGCYVLLVGPIDYFLLRRLGHRFSWTWLTFPIFVVLGCTAAANLTNLWKGADVRVHALNVIDLDTQTGFARGLMWSHVFSPSSHKYDLGFDARPAFAMTGQSHQILSWHGLPGDSFGGMNSSRTSTGPAQYRLLGNAVNQGQHLSVSGLPIDVYSSRSLHGIFWADGDIQVESELEADLEKQLTGAIQNPLNVPLRDCVLLYDRWAYLLPSIESGGTTSVGRNSKPKTIDFLVTRTRVDQDHKDLSEPWRKDDQDLSRIVEMLNLYEAAGGFKYTSMLHRFQPEVDISHHLKQGRAVLIGRTESNACPMEGLDNAVVDQTTFYRIHFPVVPRSRRTP